MNLLHLSTADPLEAAASRVFAALEIDDVFECDGDDHPAGHYFVGRTGEFVVDVGPEPPNDPLRELFQVLVLIHPPASLAASHGRVAEVAAAELLRAGFGVAEEIESTEEIALWRVFSFDDEGHLVSSEIER